MITYCRPGDCSRGGSEGNGTWRPPQALRKAQHPILVKFLMFFGAPVEKADDDTNQWTHFILWWRAADHSKIAMRRLGL